MKVIKNPVVCHAIQWTGISTPEFTNFFYYNLPEHKNVAFYYDEDVEMSVVIRIKYPIVTYIMEPTDWIVYAPDKDTLTIYSNEEFSKHFISTDRISIEGLEI